MNAKRAFFDEHSLDSGVALVVDEMADVYMSDDVPWVVGYSGGKDSTAVLALTWLALQKLGAEKAKKPVHVISTDTLVENPIVASWVGASLDKMNAAAQEQALPLTAHRLTPEISDSFWVNLIGRGYPAPRQKFRWCTERMKIRPANKFISSVVDKYGNTLLVLGIRKAESVRRAHTMQKHEKGRIRDRISPNGSLPNSYIYSPVEDWANDDVWMFLLESQNPWGQDNMELFSMYRGATEDGECPMVISSGTPSCGDSRFGCWVCTLVEKDKSMQAMIRNDGEKKWMKPLLEIRSMIDFRSMDGGDRPLRDFRRMNGSVQAFHDSYVPGPYKQKFRAELLHRVLETQTLVRSIGPEYVRNLSLIQVEELEEIRRIWVVEKHEMEDVLPSIYKDATGEEYPVLPTEDKGAFGAAELGLLKGLCDSSEHQYEMLREMLSIGQHHKHSYRRKGVFDALEKAVERNFYDDAKDALDRAASRAKVLSK